MRSILFCCFLATSAMYAQKFPVNQIQPELLKNADAVIRHYQQDIYIEDIDEMVVKTKRVVTVMNEAGENFLDAYEYYDKSDDIEEQEAYIYDENGEEIEHFKHKEFIDQSAYAAFILYSDNRVSYLDYTPRRYPYTVEYISEMETPNTIFIADWQPIEGYSVSLEKNVRKIHNPQKFPLRWKSRNLEGYEVTVDSVGNELTFIAENIGAMKDERYTPDLSSFTPRISTSLSNFNLEGVAGEAENWKQFGKWMYDNLVDGLDELPQETIAEITNLVADAESKEEKIRRIYQYVQDNTRYIAVMYGIGGWKPFTANEVDQLGYGDCKALTNYTKALLRSQDIESYYTVIYGGKKRNMEPDFTKMQGNHVILNVPGKDSTDYWLECTSQTVPFNYMGDFTDDRYALLLKPDGGEIIKTTIYKPEDNLQVIDCNIQLNENGGFSAKFNRESFGVSYGDVYNMASYTDKEIKKHYRKSWNRIQNLEFNKFDFNNDKRNIVFTENIEFKGDRLATNAGTRLLLPLNFVHQSTFVLGPNKNRKLPMEITRGRSFKDHFSFKLPEGFAIEALPESVKLETEFGMFYIEIAAAADGSEIDINRGLQINQGSWPAEKYEAFRSFINKMNHFNNLKAVIIKKS